MDNLKNDDFETKENLEEKHEENPVEEIKEQETIKESVEVNDAEEKVVEEKIEEEKIVEEKTVESNANSNEGEESQVDVKESFDKFISKKNLLEYIMCGISVVFVLDLLYMVIKLISVGSLGRGGSSTENYLSGITKAASKYSSLRTVANLRDFSHFLVFLSIVLILVMIYKSIVLDKKNDFFKLTKNLYFIGANVVVVVAGLLLKSALRHLSTVMLYISILVYLAAIAGFGYIVYILYLRMFKSKK
ncbi:hypothetical protein VJI77_04230 [Parvimonas sp. D2]|uniref:hypothetical protein n=1 Tax=unclassified Parvimonas TaxID=1151464 RepID=UPI002B4A1896|nr:MULTISPECIES: hypothetical protein [unclassified Parvimonas]MEB3012200.1 hypothetical protein [Parvimonas sp. D2]MEB3087855.1 hypothetical protein [Parvimonas sp. D4]